MIFDAPGSNPASFTVGEEVLHGEVSRDGSKIVCGFASSFQIVDVSSRKVENKYKIQGNINCIKFGEHTNQFLIVTNKNVLHIHSGESSVDVPLPDEGNALILSNGIVYVGSKKGNLIAVDLATKAVKSNINISSSKITVLRATNDRKRIAIGSSNGLLSFYDVESSTLIPTDMKYHLLPITSIDITTDDSLCITSAHERDVHTWDIQQYKHVDKVEAVHRNAVMGVALTKNGQAFYSFGHDGSIQRTKLT